ncbi:ribonuclease H-like domain-containing protein, partial [Tanacetum coccineum]
YLSRTMNPSAANQITLDNALVAPEARLKIGECNRRIKFTNSQREATYQVTLDALKLSPCYLACLVTAGVPEIYMHQFWNTVTKVQDSSSYRFHLDNKMFRANAEIFCDILQIYPKLPDQPFDIPPSTDEEIMSFIYELGYSGNIETLTELVVDYMHQPTIGTSAHMEDDVDISTLTIEQYIALILDDMKPDIVNPKIGEDVEFEINENFMRELRRKLFTGTDDEDAYEHLRMVLEIVDLFHFPGVTHDAIMLRVFPITLKGRALRWKDRLPAGSITTWDLLKKEFIWRYCHPFITAKKLEEICNFELGRDETLYYAWERYNDLLYQCPLHDLNCRQKVHIFYTGLDISTHKILNSNGFIPLMTPTQALESIQVIANHSHNWYDETTTRERINDVLDNVDAIH